MTVSGLLTQKLNGASKCYDAFYYNTCGNFGQGNGGVNSIWLVPPGWTGDQSSVVLLSSLSDSSYPAFRSDHFYALTLDLSGKDGWSLFAAATVRGGTLADWSGEFTLDFAGAPAPPPGGPAVSEPAPGSWSIATPGVALCGGGIYSYAARISAAAGQALCNTSVGVSDSAGNFAKTTIVGVGERTRAQATGEAVATCWLLGPDALPLDNAKLNAYINQRGGSRAEFDRKLASASPQLALAACMQLVTQFLDTSRSTQATGTMQAVAGVCRAERLALAFAFRGGKVVSIRPAPFTASSIRYRCTATGGKTTITIAGPNQRAELGPKLRLGVYRAKNATRRKAKLTFTLPTATAKAKPGHYSGQTSDNHPVSFDVTADSANVDNVKAAGHVTCTDNSSWTWTITSAANNPISTSLGFSRSYTGGLTINDPTYANINVTYTLTGTLTPTGTATGSFQISHIAWDHDGTHYDCTGTQATWTAALSG